MYRKTRVVICYAGATESVHHIIGAMCEAAWDAGAELRIRSVGQISPSEDSPDNTGRPEILRELETMPPAIAQDLAWSDVVVFGMELVEGELPLTLDRLIGDGRAADCEPANFPRSGRRMRSPAT